MERRAAIVGGAAVTALGDDPAALAAALAAGASAVRPNPPPLPGGLPLAARLPAARAGLPEDPTLRLLGPHGEQLDACARRAHAQAGWSALVRERVGLFAAVGMVDSPPEELAPAVDASRGADGAFDLERFFAGGFRALHPLWPLAMLPNVAVGHVAIALDLRGDNTVLASEADAGGRVLGEALRALRLGTVDAALAGGVSEPVNAQSLLRRALRGRLAWAESAPGAGLPAGEGAAVLALERPASAAARGARVLGFLGGQGQAFDPDREQARREAVRRALDDAGCAPRAVALHLHDADGAARVDAGAGTPRALAPALGHLLGAHAALGVLLALAPGAAPAPGPVVVSVTSDGGSAAALVVEPLPCAS